MYAGDKASHNIIDVGSAAAGRINGHLAVMHGHIEMFCQLCGSDGGGEKRTGRWFAADLSYHIYVRALGGTGPVPPRKTLEQHDGQIGAVAAVDAQIQAEMCHDVLFVIFAEEVAGGIPVFVGSIHRYPSVTRQQELCPHMILAVAGEGGYMTCRYVFVS